METVSETLNWPVYHKREGSTALQRLLENTQSSRKSVMDFAEHIDHLVVIGHIRLDDENRKDREACK